MARQTVRVLIPRNTGDLLKLGQSVYNKHNNDGAASPLSNMADYNWIETAPKLAQAVQMQAQVDGFRKQAEMLQEQIDALSKDVKGSVTGSRDVLLGINKKSPKKLGDWGFTVDDSPKAKSATPTKS